jgi:hypothetical protein
MFALAGVDAYVGCAGANCAGRGASSSWMLSLLPKHMADDTTRYLDMLYTVAEIVRLWYLYLVNWRFGNVLKVKVDGCLFHLGPCSCTAHLDDVPQIELKLVVLAETLDGT